MLGCDFLHNSGTMIDVKGSFMTFNGSNIVKILKGNRPLVLSDITTTTSYIIGANSETLIPAFVRLIEANTKLSDRYPLHVVASFSLPDSDGMVSLRILNPTETPILLHKGTSVGLFSERPPMTLCHPLNPLIAKL